MPYYGAALGLIGNIAGAYMAGSAAKKRRRELEKLANTPGIDIGDVTSENLQGILGNVQAAGQAGRELTMADQATLDEQLEGAMPGYSLRQAKQAAIIDSML